MPTNMSVLSGERPVSTLSLSLSPCTRKQKKVRCENDISRSYKNVISSKKNVIIVFAGLYILKPKRKSINEDLITP